ncbi:MAG: ABC transporter substrate-binding protein [Elusimicrobia bacterium]|nr:ABC transporter substrate-binding protein [Elusimicrobiota bacterium]
MLITLIAALLLANAGAAVKNPDTFIELKAGGDIDSLDPAWAFDTASGEIVANVYELLISYKDGSLKNFIPRLAQKVPSRANGLISQDGKTYTFPIRQGVKFHEGQGLACEDARYSILRFMIQDRAGGGSFLLLDPIAGLSSSRDETGNPVLNFDDIASRVTCQGQNLKITLPKPYAPFLSIIAQCLHVIGKEWAVSHGEWDGKEATWKNFNNPKKENSYIFDHANGTGAFLLERWDKNTKQIILARNDNYWREPSKLKRVIIKGIPEFTTRKLMIASGDADFIDETNRQFEPQLDNLPGVKLLDFPYLRLEALSFTFNISTTANTAVYSGQLDGNGIPPDFFQDKDLRQGFAYAFDYGNYLKEVYRGKAAQPRGPIPEGMFGFNPKQTVYALNPAKAKEHFQKAWAGQVWEKGFKFAVYYDVNNTIRQMACEILKKGVESLNPKFIIEVRAIQWSSYLSEMRQRKLPMFKLSWVADFPDPHNFTFALLHSNGSYPVRQGFKSPDMDKLIEQANNEIVPKKREALYFKLQELCFDEVPHIFTDQPTAFRVMRGWVKGYQPNPIFHGIYFHPVYKQEP